MLNGPCGGSVNGKCEVGNYQRDCGWILIYNRLKAMNRLDLFLKIRPPRSWVQAGIPREMCVDREGIIPGVPVICKDCGNANSKDNGEGGKQNE
jgi:hypothetical protein